MGMRDAIAWLLKAARGEGSRGGRVIGHDRSGRPIYDSGFQRFQRERPSSAPRAERRRQYHAAEKEAPKPTRAHVEAFKAKFGELRDQMLQALTKGAKGASAALFHAALKVSTTWEAFEHYLKKRGADAEHVVMHAFIEAPHMFHVVHEAAHHSHILTADVRSRVEALLLKARRGSAFERKQRAAQDADFDATFAENQNRADPLSKMLDGGHAGRLREEATAAHADFQKEAKRVLGGRKGEGSRGGTVVRRTKTGKPVYDPKQRRQTAGALTSALTNRIGAMNAKARASRDAMQEAEDDARYGQPGKSRAQVEREAAGRREQRAVDRMTGPQEKAREQSPPPRQGEVNAQGDKGGDPFTRTKVEDVKAGFRARWYNSDNELVEKTVKRVIESDLGNSFTFEWEEGGKSATSPRGRELEFAPPAGGAQPLEGEAKEKHLANLKEKARAYDAKKQGATVTDVTPEGYGPGGSEKPEQESSGGGAQRLADQGHEDDTALLGETSPQLEFGKTSKQDAAAAYRAGKARGVYKASVQGAINALLKAAGERLGMPMGTAPSPGRATAGPARGEGSRGGRILGHTRSGKPIYETHGAGLASDYKRRVKAAHAGFSADDHADASALHAKHWKEAKARGDNVAAMRHSQHRGHHTTLGREARNSGRFSSDFMAKRKLSGSDPGKFRPTRDASGRLSGVKRQKRPGVPHQAEKADEINRAYGGRLSSGSKYSYGEEAEAAAWDPRQRKLFKGSVRDAVGALLLKARS